MVIEAGKGFTWKEESSHIDVFRTEHLLQFNGFIDGHKIIEIERISDEYVAVKTVGWNK